MALGEIDGSISDIVYSWILFKRERGRLMPVEIAAPQMVVSQCTLHDDVSELEVGPFLEQLNKPTFFIVEKRGPGYQLGSGWELQETEIEGPMTEGRGDYCLIEKFSRTRYAVFEVQNRFRLIITRKESEDTVSFVMSREVDGGSALDTYGLLDRNSGEILVSFTNMLYKSCPFCEVRGTICECPPCLTEEYFRGQLAMRQSKRRVSPAVSGAYYDDYLSSWLSGRFHYQINGKTGASVKNIFHTSGDVFDKSLSTVIRSEMEKILKPTKGLLSTEDDLLSSPCSDIVSSLSDTGEEDGKVLRIVGTETLPNLTNSREHNKTSLFSCPICHAPIKRKYDIQRHIRGVHEKVRAFNCKLCTQTFLQRGHLNAHVLYTHKKHTDSTCPDCGKSFAGRSKLNRHFDTVHANIRKFACTICEKTYKDLKALKQHNSAQHGGAAVDKSQGASEC